MDNTLRLRHAKMRTNSVENVDLPSHHRLPFHQILIFQTVILATHWTMMKNTTTCTIVHTVR